MAEYGVSEITRSALIDAAGRLFTERGLDRSTLRDIADRAGVKTALIAYHFGNREGLIRAVVECAARPWDERRIAAYVADNAGRFDSADGRRQLVADMIEMLFRAIYDGEAEHAWRNIFLAQSLQRAYPFRDEIIERIVTPLLKLFTAVFARITGNDDAETAHCWFMEIIAPALMLAGNPVAMSIINGDRRPPYFLYRRMQHICTRNALWSAGLPVE